MTKEICIYCKKEYLGRRRSKYCSLMCFSTDYRGVKFSKEHRKKLSLAKLGKPGNMRGYKFTEEQLKRLSESHMGHIAWNKGRPMFQMRGENHPRWKGGKNLRLNATLEWKLWREAVFKRDGYKCFDCGEGGYLEPHHILPLKETLSRAFDINNGITLCRSCHMKTMGKELGLMRTYFSFVQARV